jgi:para-aminobenzoate synthetase component II
MILVIDNYDSFTFNLVQYLGEMGHELKVFRNDAITIPQIGKLAPDSIVISPGPGRPENSGVIIETIKEFAGSIPIFGVCLGHQAIGAAFGGQVVSAPKIMHGKTSEVYHDGRTIFTGLPSPFIATRYHSLVVSPDNLPECLEVSAKTEDGVIMGLRHRSLTVEGVQFHPESILTEVGKKLLSNFVNMPGGQARYESRK